MFFIQYKHKVLKVNVLNGRIEGIWVYPFNPPFYINALYLNEHHSLVFQCYHNFLRQWALLLLISLVSQFSLTEITHNFFLKWLETRMVILMFLSFMIFIFLCFSFIIQLTILFLICYSESLLKKMINRSYTPIHTYDIMISIRLFNRNKKNKLFI